MSFRYLYSDPFKFHIVEILDLKKTNATLDFHRIYVLFNKDLMISRMQNN